MENPKEATARWNEEDCDFMIADRGYDDDGFRAKLTEHHIEPVIPGKRTV